MKILYNSLIEYREPETNRIPIQVFMCLPSRKEFPEYFNVISKPIAMNKIRERIEQHFYADVNSCLEDFKLMFTNCKFFNEENSTIYNDAVYLESMLVEKYNNNCNNTNNNSNTNGVDISNDDTSTMQSDSTIHSKTNQQTNGKEEIVDSSTRFNHDHLNETSMDSSSNLSADVLASTPVEKCSLNTRRGRNPEAPKRQLLTGYIIYASEIRKEVIDKNPNQNFGDISRLVGNEWKALPHDIRSKYDQRALIHNKRVRERAQRELHTPTVDGHTLPNGSSTPKLTKRKLAKLAKEQMRQHHLSIARNDDSLTQTPRAGQDYSTASASQLSNSTYKHPHQQQLATQLSAQSSSGKTTTVDSSTQTTAIRFVEPPTKKRLVYSESFRKYIEGLKVPNRDLLVEETAPERPPELPTHWLGAGIGRHESPEAALWALRDFMLQDAVTMRKNMEPYLYTDQRSASGVDI